MKFLESNDKLKIRNRGCQGFRTIREKYVMQLKQQNTPDRYGEADIFRAIGRTPLGTI